MQSHQTANATQSAKVSLTKERLAWLIALFFGLQSVLYYSLLTWLPSIWQHAGFDAVTAGTLATIFQLFGLPLNMLTPTLAERKHGLTTVVLIAAGGFIIGLVGVLIGPSVFWIQALMAIIMGAGSGAAFSICIVFFQKKDPNSTRHCQLVRNGAIRWVYFSGDWPSEFLLVGASHRLAWRGHRMLRFEFVDGMIGLIIAKRPAMAA